MKVKMNMHKKILLVLTASLFSCMNIHGMNDRKPCNEVVDILSSAYLSAQTRKMLCKRLFEQDIKPVSGILKNSGPVYDLSLLENEDTFDTLCAKNTGLNESNGMLSSDDGIIDQDSHKNKKHKSRDDYSYLRSMNSVNDNVNLLDDKDKIVWRIKLKRSNSI